MATFASPKSRDAGARGSSPQAISASRYKTGRSSTTPTLSGSSRSWMSRAPGTTAPASGGDRAGRAGALGRDRGREARSLQRSPPNSSPARGKPSTAERGSGGRPPRARTSRAQSLSTSRWPTSPTREPATTEPSPLRAFDVGRIRRRERHASACRAPIQTQAHVLGQIGDKVLAGIWNRARAVPHEQGFSDGPGRIRTSDRRIMSPLL
jgi:hypothetical protein